MSFDIAKYPTGIGRLRGVTTVTEEESAETA